MKKVINENKLIKIIWGRWKYEKEWKILMEQETYNLGCKYKKMGNKKCFENLIIVSNSILYNIFHNIMKWLSLNNGCRHDWPNHIKTSNIFMWFYIFELALFILKSPTQRLEACIF